MKYMIELIRTLSCMVEVDAVSEKEAEEFALEDADFEDWETEETEAKVIPWGFNE